MNLDIKEFRKKYGVEWVEQDEAEELFSYHKNGQFSKLLCMVENLCRVANSCTPEGGKREPIDLSQVQ